MIGLMDSGLGGLTVLEEILKQPLLVNNQFVYFADRANIPYSAFFIENREEELRQILVKNLSFLLKYPLTRMVLACNTASVFGKLELERYLYSRGLNIPVYGMIEAAMHVLWEESFDSDFSVGVMATAGTVASNAYQESLEQSRAINMPHKKIYVYQQGCPGIAESIEELEAYCTTSHDTPHDGYRGPVLSGDNIFPYSEALSWDIYNFDTSHHRMLYDGETLDESSIIQINHVTNYVRYYLISLLEQMRLSEKAPPLYGIILGCTHYVYIVPILRQLLSEFYHMKTPNGGYRYRRFLTHHVKLIDPAKGVAQKILLDKEALTPQSVERTECRFYVSQESEHNPFTVLTASHLTVNQKAMLQHQLPQVAKQLF